MQYVCDMYVHKHYSLNQSQLAMCHLFCLIEIKQLRHWYTRKQENMHEFGQVLACFMHVEICVCVFIQTQTTKTVSVDDG